ncbi:MAG TPA: serine/threonine-protein kinase [Kofleriaceae bacterium]|nr:serine/threonine-protein kinase [Kofleriaceae bacterium]
MERVRPSVLQTGDVIEGRYHLLKIIGQGGMATVYLAEHVLIHRRVAVKVLHPELATDGAVVERFMNEARAAGTLGHPNIIESTDMGFAGAGVPYIVFEYLEGTSLFDEVYRLGGLRPTRALKIARQIAGALAAAHSAGIVHCDLKSDNVFLTDKDDVMDHVKVLDFGISRFQSFGRDQPRDGEPSGVVLGTPEFMAPEQLNAPDSVDARADIYALGVVLYEMLERRTPFVRDPKDPQALLRAIVADPPPAFSRADLPAALTEMIIEKLLAKEPAKRYSSMKDVESALEGFAGLLHRDSLAIRKVVTLPPPIGGYPVLGDHDLGTMPVVRSSVDLGAPAPPTDSMRVPDTAVPAPPDHKDVSRATSKDTSKDAPGVARKRLAVFVASFAVCALGSVAWLATRSSSRLQAAESSAVESSAVAPATTEIAASPQSLSFSLLPSSDPGSSVAAEPPPTAAPAEPPQTTAAAEPPATAAPADPPQTAAVAEQPKGGAVAELPQTAAPAEPLTAAPTEPPKTVPAARTPTSRPSAHPPIAKRRPPARPAQTEGETTPVENEPPTTPEAPTPVPWDEDSLLPPP